MKRSLESKQASWNKRNFSSILLLSDTLLHIMWTRSNHLEDANNLHSKYIIKSIHKSSNRIDFRQLLTFGMWVSVCKINGLLPHSNLHSGLADCCYFVGVLLAEQGSNPSKSNARGYYGPYDDNAHLFHKCFPSQNILCQVHRCLLSFLLLHGICFSNR